MKEKKSFNLISLIFLGIVLILIAILLFSIRTNKFATKNDDLANYTNLNNENTVSNEISETVNEELDEEVVIENYDSSMFDLVFLKLENQKENKVYSPLSIKYALKMLEEGANGETKNQILNILGENKLTKYASNQNLSLANSFFIRDSYKNQIKADFINTLKNEYNAEVRFDKFENSDNINNWINEKTLEIIPQIISDEDVQELDFALINALAIDMEWKFNFINKYKDTKYGRTTFFHEQIKIENETDNDIFFNKWLNVYVDENVRANTFNSEGEELKVSGMTIYATINNYDIVNELGEEYIKNTVSEEYRKFAKDEPYDTEHVYGDFPLSEDVSDAGIEKDLNEFLPGYITELSDNYHKLDSTTDFSIYTDEEVKVFAKDLKEYDGVTLQYIGIMPTEESLDSFIDKIDMSKINNYISNLKNVEIYNDFEEGVVTKIYGYIPKFTFEYDLNLMRDLKACKLTNVFDIEKADLSNMTNDEAYINRVLHKANIEFTQDGIKAAAATKLGGEGAGSPFDYFFDVPVVEIDMNFNKPYMFLIQDKETRETWFAGTVYEPLLWEDEPESIYSY